MRNFGTLLTVILGFGISTVMAVPAVPAGDQAKVTQLIAKLGSPNFRERDSASKELDAIGEAALEALRKAAKNNDMEIANRAAGLVTKIEQRAENARLLAPTYVELSLKDVTVEAAVAELVKKSGYNIVLAGDKTKLSERKVTLETGRVPFWKALDMLCDKAGLIDADSSQVTGIDLPPNGQPVPLPVQIQPIQIQPIQIQPIQIKPIKVQPIQIKRIQIQPVPAEKPIEEKKPVEPKAPEGFSADQPAQPAPQKTEVPVQRAVAPAIVPAQPAQAQPAPVPVVQIAQPVQVQPAQPIRKPIGGRAYLQPVAQGVAIILVDSKSVIPAHVDGAIRVRAINNINLLNNYGPTPDGEIGVLLEVKAEPKLQLLQILGVKIDKALDNHDQLLTPTMVSNVNGAQDEVQQLIQLKQAQIQIQGRAMAPTYPTQGYGSNMMVPTRLKKGDKEPKSLKELRGSVSVVMRTAVEDIVSVDDILKAKGNSVKGKSDAVIKVLDIEKAANGDLKVQVEVQFSNDVQPHVNRQVGVPQPQPIGGNIRIQIAPAAPAPPANAPNGGVVAAQPAVYNHLGLEMLDEKGVTFQLTQMQLTKNQWMGNARSMSATMTFHPVKDQGDAAKLVFRGTRNATVDVPFLLKDVPVK